LSDRALLGAYANNSQTVNIKIVDKSAKEVLGISHKPDNVFLKIVLSGLILIASLIVLMNYWESGKSLKQQVDLSENIDKPKREEIPKQKPEKIVIKTLPPSKPLDFISSLKQQTISLNTAISRLAKVWNKEINEASGCENIEGVGLQCLFSKTNWDKLKALNRPVIMEFTDSTSKKFYGVLLGLKQGKPIFFVNENISFPLEKILALWNGYFLILWQSPIDNIKEVYPGLTSDAVVWIRHKIALHRNYSLNNLNSTIFDDELKSEIIKFQQLHQLKPDGIVGPKTFIHLKNIDPENDTPKLKLIP
jgi:general secretion pathway protein A